MALAIEVARTPNERCGGLVTVRGPEPGRVEIFECDRAVPCAVHSLEVMRRIVPRGTIFMDPKVIAPLTSPEPACHHLWT